VFLILLRKEKKGTGTKRRGSSSIGERKSRLVSRDEKKEKSIFYFFRSKKTSIEGGGEGRKNKGKRGTDLLFLYLEMERGKKKGDVTDIVAS